MLGQPDPAFELGLRLGRPPAPVGVQPHVVHGDFRLGNLMVETTGLAAVLDWELAHLGDPIEDGWAVRAGLSPGSDLPVAGLGP